MQKLRKISDDDCQITWISDEVDYGDFPLRYHIVLEYTDSWGDDCGFKYYVSVKVTSLVAAANVIPSLLSNVGMTPEEFAEVGPEHQSEMLCSFASATLFQKGGKNKRNLLLAARRELIVIGMLFGLYMDKPQNVIGSDGWDFIKGDILAGSYRARALA